MKAITLKKSSLQNIRIANYYLQRKNQLADELKDLMKLRTVIQGTMAGKYTEF